MTDRTLLALIRPTLLALLALCWVAPPALARDQPWDQNHDFTEDDKPDPPGPCEGEHCDPCKSTGSPVYIPTGHFIWSETDASLPGRPALSLTRTYNSHDPRVGQFGNGWTADCGVRLIKTVDSQVDERGNQVRRPSVALIASNGKRYKYQRSSGANYVSLGGRTDTIRDSGNGGLILTSQSGYVTEFDQAGRITRRQEPSGRRTDYTYSDSGQLTRIADGNDRYLAFVYDARGLTESVTDHTGRDWRYEYDENANLIAVTDPGGGVTRYEYQAVTPDNEGFTYYQLTRIIDPTDVVITEVTYSGTRVASYTSGANTYNYSYNKATRQVTKTDAQNSRWVFAYDAEQQITQRTDPLRATLTYTYDADGNLTAYTDQAGNTWSATFDEHKRKLSDVSPLGHTTEYSYGTDYPFATRVKTPTGREIAMELNAQGNVVLTTNSAGDSMLMEWSEDGDLVKATDPLGNTQALTYTSNGLIATSTDPLGISIRFAYDEVGNVISETNGAGETTTYEYDALNRVTAVTDPLGRKTTYSYDLAGRILTVTAANGERVSYDYDALGRLATRTDFDGKTETVVYRNDNLPDTITNVDGTTERYTYDANKRITRKQTGTLSTSYQYDTRGLLIEATNEAGTVSFAYDAEGRLTQEANNAVVEYSYNAEDELITSNALGRAETFAYDKRGLLAKLTTPEGDFDFGYDSLSRRTQLTYPDGSKVNYGFDKAGRLVQQAFTGKFEKAFDYSFDNASRLTDWTGDGPDRSYGYDAASQVTAVTDHLGSYNFSYDALGNRTSGGGTFDAANRLLENNTHTFSYDGRGNMLEKVNKETGARAVYTWNARNQLITLQRFDSAEAEAPTTTTTYTYGPLGRRWSRTHENNTEQFAYRGDDLIATFDGNGTALAQHSFGPGIDEPLVRTNEAGEAYYFSDYLGSVQAISGTELAEYDYSAYGMPEGSGLTTDNLFTYTGREYEGDELYYYRNRYYDAEIGRFLQSDPIGLQGGINTYTYVGGNPVGYIDPFGLQIAPPMLLPRPWVLPQVRPVPNSPVQPWVVPGVESTPWPMGPKKDPNGNECKNLAERIQSTRNEIYNKRFPDLESNPGGLPERLGPGEKLRETIRGHRKLLDRRLNELKKLEDEYADKCLPPTFMC